MGNDRLLGRVVGRYRIESVLGRGGMGVVYRARDERLDRIVALKVLSDERATDAGFRERFLRESRLLASLDHPNIVPVFEADEADGELYIAMRFVQGPELGRIIERDGPMAPSRAVAIIAQVADALDAAHATGLVHRDIKPANILVVSGPSSDHAYLTDFGLTKMAGASTGLTQAGQFVGTPGYVAPEQIQGRGVDHRSDVYALGCVLYDCLTGSVPYPRDSTMASLWAHVHEVPPRPSDVRPGLPLTFDAVIARALAKAPDERYQTAGGLALAARKAIPVSAAAATTVADTPPELLAGALLSADAQRGSTGDEAATTSAALAAASTAPSEPGSPDPVTIASADPDGTVVVAAGTATVVATGAPSTVAGGTPPPSEPRPTVVAGGDRPRWRTTPFVGLSAALIGILAVTGLAFGSGLIDLTGGAGNPGPTGTHLVVGTPPPFGGATPEPVASASLEPSQSGVGSLGPSTAPSDSAGAIPTVHVDPPTARPPTPRPPTPRPPTPRPPTPRPPTPKPPTPKPPTPKPATPTPGPVNEAPVAIADPITFASATSHSHYDLALMDNDTDSDDINDSIFYHDNTQPSYGTITGWVECTYNGRTQYCLRYDPNFSGPFTDYFYYRIKDNPGGLVSDWALVTVKFNS